MWNSSEWSTRMSLMRMKYHREGAPGRGEKMAEIKKKTVSWQDDLILHLRGVFEEAAGVTHCRALWRFTCERAA